jgi:hypothetical protein
MKKATQGIGSELINGPPVDGVNLASPARGDIARQ